MLCPIGNNLVFTTIAVMVIQSGDTVTQGLAYVKFTTVSQFDIGHLNDGAFCLSLRLKNTFHD